MLEVARAEDLLLLLRRPGEMCCMVEDEEERYCNRYETKDCRYYEKEMVECETIIP